MTSLCFFVAVGGPQLYYSKGSFHFIFTAIRLSWTTRLASGFLYTKRPVQSDRSFSCRHRSIFPGNHPPSIFDTDELNFCVRNGNRWILIASNTDFNIELNKNTFRTKITWSSPRPISIAKLNVSPHLHLQPINLVVFKGSYLITQWDILSQERLHA